MRAGSTKVVLLTAPGRGAVATLVVAGDRATELVGQGIVTAGARPLADAPIGAIVFGRWGAREPREEVVVCRIDRRRVEIHCHGGTAAVTRIMNTLERLGAVRTDWAAWARQCGESPIRIAAVGCLTQARTERTAAILLDQYRGALALALGQIVEHLTARRLEAAAAKLETLLENARVGRHLTHPWKVVLAGKPNAGKSSLMNALLGYERTLVFAEPGTTRDVVTASAAMDGWPVELADTAGLRAGRDDIETIGIQRASDCLAGAELVVVVHDATLPWSDVEIQLCHAASAVVVAHNKTDLNPACVTQNDGVRTSATLGQGIEELRERITRALVPRPPHPGSAVPFSVDLSKAIEQAYAAALRSDPQLAIQLLHDTIGSSDSVVS